MINWIENWPTWAKITVPIVVGMTILGALIPEEKKPPEQPVAPTPAKTAKASESPESAPAEVNKSKAPKPAKKPEPAPKPPSVETQVREAIEGSGMAMEDNNVRDIYRTGNMLEIHLVTPKGGLNGPSVDDLDDQAAGAFHAIYGDTEFKGSTALFFEGGLINAKTGQDAPDAQTGSFAMRKGEASQIDWSDEDTVRFAIDWSLYRTGVSPAIRGS